MGSLASDRLAGASSMAVSAGRFSHEGERAEAVIRFDALYAVYRPLLRKIAIRKFGIAVSDADDLVQDVFATYLANPSNVRELHPYLIGAICNASRQHRRRSATSPFCESNACGATPDDELVDGVVRNVVIASTLSRLGVRCRETLERFYLNGETAGSIAESRDTSAGYIWRLLNYCRNRARAVYEQMSVGS
jgi:RNA polymerase sigma factor (sigma-70 family)